MSNLQFYLERIDAAPAYGFNAGEGIINTVISAASGDVTLTEDEFELIIEMVNKCHIKMLEVNYNDGWNN